MTWQKGHFIKDRKYKIEYELDRGGWGNIYLASNDRGESVAIKFLHEKLKQREDYDKIEQDFINEARQLAKFSHLPHIVKIYDVLTEGDKWGIVMEYINGESLSWKGILSERLALLYIQQVSSSLAEIHDNGLLHRDINPSNILVREDVDEAILIDFGIAREFTPEKIQTHTVAFTDFYSAPEQYESRTVRSPSSDIYSLAATLYKVTTNEEPEGSRSRRQGCVLRTPKQINPNVNDVVEAAILKGLELKACDRPQTVKEWLGMMGLDLIAYSEVTQPTLNTKRVEEIIAEEKERQRIEARIKFYTSELLSTDQQSRYRAFEELGKIGKKAFPAIPNLIQIMEKVNDELNLATDTLIKIGSASVIPLSQLLNHEDIKVRRRASHALESIGSEAIDSIDSLILRLEDEDAEVRWYCTITLGKIGIPSQRATSKLISKLKDSKLGVRAFAAYALGKMRSKESVASLLEIVKNENEDQQVFVASLEALRAIGYDMQELEFTGDTETLSVDKVIELYRDTWSKEESEQKAKHTGMTGYFRRPLHANTPPQ
ncbi:protein kinase [Pseudanabaena biceps]|nr:protein kinase [Pseudanabaena biceps]